jgi:hypothetical protein
MTRAQAIILSVLTGLVVLVCVGLFMLILLPNRLIPAFAPPTLLSPTLAPTPSLPKFLPTGSLHTPVLDPTATNTRVATPTPAPAKTATPTVNFELKMPLNPTATPTPVKIVPVATATPVPTEAAVPGARGYSVSFEADETEVEKGDCTTIRWHIEGAESVILNNQTVEFIGKKKVCPKFETTYQLTVSRPNETELIIRKIEISIDKDEEEDEEN